MLNVSVVATAGSALAAVRSAYVNSTNLGSPADWGTNSPEPVVIGGQNVVINPITGPRSFSG